jgi:hypothetical protein
MDPSVKRTNDAPTKSVTRDYSEPTKSIRTDYYTEPTKSVTRDHGVVHGAGKSAEKPAVNYPGGKEYDAKDKGREFHHRYETLNKATSNH